MELVPIARMDYSCLLYTSRPEDKYYMAGYIMRANEEQERQQAQKKVIA